MRQLFTNSVVIKGSKKMIGEFLSQAGLLMKWNPAISDVKKIGENSFAIHRDGDALNKDEIISITKTNGRIVYTSTDGKLEYRLVFDLTDENGQTLVKEAMLITNENYLHLPLTLLAPIAKYAFNQNLNILRQIN